MNTLTKISLRTKIIGMVLLICVLLGGGGLFAFKRFAADYKKQTYNQAENFAETLGDKIGAQFFERYGDIQAFATNPLVESLDAKELPSALDKYVRLYGLYDVILVVDKNGKYVASNTIDSKGKGINVEALKASNFSTSPWYQAAAKGEWTSDKSKNFDGTFVESVHVDPIYKLSHNEKRAGASFTAAVTDKQGQVVGFITNRANNMWFELEMAKIYDLEKEDGKADAEVTILDKDGFVISNLAPKRHGNKIEFDDANGDVLFNENIFKVHVPAGEAMAKKGTGALISKDGDDPGSDLVGYHFVDNPKWISSLGWTTMVHIDSELAFMAVQSAEMNYYLIFAMIAFVSMALAIWFGFVISKSVNTLTVDLSKNSKDVSDASLQIAAQSIQLSESATEQAAALQETVAAVDEISAMVEKNAEAANKSKEVSGQSREAAMKGRQTVESMIQAIGDISSSNEEITEQMQSNNRQLSEITKLINEIGSKTKVINEIVFQTKLLSFNASVEAARAGEYGKGFAVVAEEVGNLAQMSGNAAKEITEMLEQSVHQVESIVNDTKSKVDRLMASSKQKIEAGSATANECNESLEEILANVSSVDTLVSEIAVASQEQSTGIREISKAVGQMEQVTQQNSLVSQQASTAAEKLSSQSQSLNHIVVDLTALVHGSGSKQVSASEHQDSKKDSDTQNAKVIKMKQKSPKVEVKEDVPQMKKAQGSDYIPSSNDPGFNG